MADAVQKLKLYSDKVGGAKAIDELRGIEGSASRKYFDAFPDILDQSLWNWKGRSQHPGKDPINALLNYGYAFLDREVRVAILMCGMDSRIGFFHANDGRKHSLVFDLMELFRQPVIDPLVLTLANQRSIKPDDFIKSKDECRLTDSARLAWYSRYEEYMLRPYKEYGERNSREMILDRVRKFSTRLDYKK